VRLKERILYLFHRASHHLEKKKDKAWSGLSVMVFREDHQESPMRMRINYYISFFTLAIVISLPSLGLGLYIKRTLNKSPQTMLFSRRVLLSNLKLMTSEKKELMEKASEQIELFHKLSGTQESEKITSLASSKKDSTEIPFDSLGRDLVIMKSLRTESFILFDYAAYHALNQIYTRMSIHHIMPRGRPLYAGIGHITSVYGYRPDPFIKGSFSTEFHMGVDFAAAPGTPIIATAPGVVTQVVNSIKGGYGLMVRIHHGLGYMTIYAHNQVNAVVPGQRVKRGDIVGGVGKTGTATGHHVHYEMHYGASDSLDPMQFIQLK